MVLVLKNLTWNNIFLSLNSKQERCVANVKVFTHYVCFSYEASLAKLSYTWYVDMYALCAWLGSLCMHVGMHNGGCVCLASVVDVWVCTSVHAYMSVTGD